MYIGGLFSSFSTRIFNLTFNVTYSDLGHVCGFSIFYFLQLLLFSVINKKNKKLFNNNITATYFLSKGIENLIP